MQKLKLGFAATGWYAFRKKWKLLLHRILSPQAFILALFLLLFFEPQQSNAQVVTLHVDQATPAHVFAHIERQTGFHFVYALEQLEKMSKISLHVEKMNLQRALAEIFKDQPFTYTIWGKNIAIQERAHIVAQEQTKSQNSLEISGKIFDTENHPVPGATITVSNQRKFATISGEDGSFALTVPKNSLLEVSSVGFDKKQVQIGNKTEFRIYLQQSAEALKEVVVTGIFDRPIQNFTGAATTVSGEELRRFAPQNPLMALQILDPAFQMPANLEAGSNPNVMPEVRLRGQNNFPVQQGRTNASLNALYGNNPNAPLFIMDGFEIPLQTLIDMDMNRIAKISLLKDASATAIYGSRGSNGVVVIETVKPKPGQLQIGYTGNVGFAIPDLSSYNLMNAQEKYQLEKLAGLYRTDSRYAGILDVEFSDQKIYNSIYKEVARGVDTYWLSKPLNTAISQSHSLNIMGGDQAFRYTLNGNYKITPGVMIGNSRNSFNGNISLQYITDKLTIGNNLQYIYAKGTESPYGSFRQYTQMNPFFTPYDANGNLFRFLGDFSTYVVDGNPFLRRVPNNYRIENPLYAASLNPEQYNTDSRIINNFQIKWDLFKGFFLQGRFSYTLANIEEHNFQPSTLPRFDARPFSEKGIYDLTLSKNNLWDSDLQANYSKSFGKHLIFGALSAYLKSSENIGYYQQATGFSNENMRNFIFGSQYGIGTRPSGSQSVLRQVTTRGLINYSYNNRYMFDFSYSSDGSSQFGANKRYTTFWSLGARWNLHEELFMKEFTFINRLQLRGSMGPTGGQNFPPYQGITTYGYQVGQPYRGVLSSSLLNYGDPNLQWQNTFKKNIGLDMSFVNNRINISLDVYRDKVTNTLMAVNRPPSVGFTSYSTNLGSMQNTGLELSANFGIIRDLKRDINWTVTFNATQIRNKILDLASIPSITVPLDDRGRPMPENRLQELQIRNNFKYVMGGSIDDVWAIPSAGIDPATGWEIFVMPNGEYTYSASPSFEQPLGNVQPKYSGGFNTSFQYKNWIFSAAANYRMGATIFNTNLRDRIEISDYEPFYRNLDRRVLTERWLQPGDVKPFLGLTSTPIYRTSSRFLQKENMLQIQSISLAYRFPQKWNWLQKSRMSNTMITMYWNTPFTLTTLESEQRGLDSPFQRSFSIQLSTTFF